MLHEIQVITYAGFKGEERPQSFFVGNAQVRVVAVLEMWIEEESISEKRRRFFRVLGSDGLHYKLFIDEEEKRWYLDSGSHE